MYDGDFELPKNTKLFIIPDAGTNDIEQLNKLVESGISCICLDHHEKEPSDIECKAIIVNNQMSEHYTDKSFSGVGVSYEFLRALDDYYICDYADKFLDLVAFGNIADVMSIKDFQTRYYIEEGFKNIRNKFLLAIMKAQEFSTKGIWSIFNVAWYLVPPINSLIRIGSIEDRDKLFRAFIGDETTYPYKKRGTDEIIEEDIYTHVARLCKNTKSKQDRMRDSLCEELKEQVNSDDKVSLIVTEDGESGIIGLSTMKLADSIGKPCIVVKDIGNGKLSGSARNCRNSIVKDLKELVGSVGEFDWQMGHSNAFGCQIDVDNIQAARDALNKALENYEYDDTIYVDFILDSYDLDSDFFKTLDSNKWLWGTGLDAPLVAVEGVTVSTDEIAIMGKDKNSISFFADGVKYCKFKLSQDDELLELANEASGEEIKLNVVGECSINDYGGKRVAQMIIDDYEVVDKS